MIYILLAVGISVSLLILFKLFDKYKINTLHAIVFNYFFAAITGILLAETPSQLISEFNMSWLSLTLPLGFLFIAVFYAISLTAQKISISVASVANKMSVVMPVLFSVLVLHEQITSVKAVGIVLAMIAVAFTMYKSKTDSHTAKMSFLPILVFLGSGLIDVGINFGNHQYIKTPLQTNVFTISIFSFAFLFGIGLLLYMHLKTPEIKPQNGSMLKNVIGGLALGVPNYFSIFFIMKALESKVLASALLFPLLNISNVILTACIGIFIYKEYFTKLNYIGILLAIISICLLMI